MENQILKKVAMESHKNKMQGAACSMINNVTRSKIDNVMIYSFADQQYYDGKSVNWSIEKAMMMMIRYLTSP